MKRPQFLSLSLYHVKIQQEGTVCKPGRMSSPDIKSAHTLISDFPASSLLYKPPSLQYLVKAAQREHPGLWTNPRSHLPPDIDVEWIHPMYLWPSKNSSKHSSETRAFQHLFLKKKILSNILSNIFKRIEAGSLLKFMKIMTRSASVNSYPLLQCGHD